MIRSGHPHSNTCSTHPDLRPGAGHDHRIPVSLSIAGLRLTPTFVVFGQGISGRDLILFFGGLFLLWKSSQEMYHALEGEDESDDTPSGKGGNFLYTIIQIAIIDIVFSLDSVITAVGMVSHVPVMVAAIIVAVLVMMLAAGTISDFIDKHPSLKMLALSFLLVVGTVLIAESFDVHVPKGYVYFAMAFSLRGSVNINARRAGQEETTADLVNCARTFVAVPGFQAFKPWSWLARPPQVCCCL